MSTHAPSVGIVGLRYGLAHIPAFQANGCRVVAVRQRDQAGREGGRGAGWQPVPLRWTPPPAAGKGDPTDVMGKALIAPLVTRLLGGIRTGETPSPSLVDGLRAQSVLDAVLESWRHRAWVSVAE